MCFLTLKGEIKMNKDNSKARYVEYRMPKKMFNAFVKARTGEDKKMNPYTYMMQVINTEFGILGEVKRIVLI